MSRIIEQLARRQIRVGRPDSFNLSRTDTEVSRLTDDGSLLRLSKGFYALVPEDRRRKGTTWRPTIEGTALGMAAALYGPEEVALVGPSAARIHRCYPRALGEAYVAVPKSLRPRRTIAGAIRFVARNIDQMDTVRIETDLGQGWASSIEQTALDLCRNRPTWNITAAAREEMLYRLEPRINWELIAEIAESTRGVKTLHRLRHFFGRVS